MARAAPGLLAALCCAWLSLAPASLGQAAPELPQPLPFPPLLKVDILDAQGALSAKALIYHNFLEILDARGKKLGAIGVVWAENRWQLFLVGDDTQRSLLGWSYGRQLFNAQGQLVAVYAWTPIWSYVYDTRLQRLGRAQCLAFQGVCAAGVAGWLAGLFPQPAKPEAK